MPFRTPPPPKKLIWALPTNSISKKVVPTVAPCPAAQKPGRVAKLARERMTPTRRSLLRRRSLQQEIGQLFAVDSRPQVHPCRLNGPVRNPIAISIMVHQQRIG